MKVLPQPSIIIPPDPEVVKNTPRVTLAGVKAGINEVVKSYSGDGLVTNGVLSKGAAT